ncbi:MAG: RagB/SusD family nutrient uptake outer membrane protein [Longimicrobiales bacterium]
MPLGMIRQMMRTVARPGLPALLALVLAGCDALLEVDAPSRVIGETLEGPGNAALLVAGAVADFECTFSHYIVTTGLIGDELKDTQLAAATWDYDRRSLNPAVGAAYAQGTCDAGGNIISVYQPVNMARFAADNALSKLESFTEQQVPNRSLLIATAAAYSGYSHLLLGEGFCSAVLLGDDLTPGGESTRVQVFQNAEARFTRALASGSNDASMLGLARVGRARARLNLGRYAEAEADARLVPANFVRNAAFTDIATRPSNKVTRWNRRFRWASVEDDYFNLSFGGVADPRVRLTNSGLRGADAVSIVWYADKYATESSPIQIATWEEAQLMIAEAQVRAGNGQAAVTIINDLHTRVGLPAFVSTDNAVILQQVIDERRRELFLEGQHLGDAIRYNLPLTPAVGAPYPIKGGSYGTTRCMPLPDVERINNPNFR